MKHKDSAFEREAIVKINEMADKCKADMVDYINMYMKAVFIMVCSDLANSTYTKHVRQLEAEVERLNRKVGHSEKKHKGLTTRHENLKRKLRGMQG